MAMWRRLESLFGFMFSWLPWYRRRSRDADLARELQDHLHLEEEDQQAAGLSPEQASSAAHRAFGNTLKIEEDVRRAWGFQWLESLVQDLRYGLRMLRKSPGFTAVAILTLALGIGATTALFTVVRSVLMKHLPFKDPTSLVSLYEQNSNGVPTSVAGGVFAEWQKQSTAFSSMAILSYGKYSLSGGGGELPESVLGSEVSASLFPTLEVEPAFGRGFTAAEDKLNANGTVVLSWGLWKRRFGGSPSVLGQTVELDARPYTIIGVMPLWFSYPDARVQLWTPIYHQEESQEMQAIDSHDFTAIARLKSGVSEKKGTAQLSVIVRRLHDQHLDNPFVSITANSRPLLEDMVGDARAPLYILLAATGCLLLIGCLNVASLMIARGAARRRDLAIRTALGGSRWRLFRQHVTEGLIVSIVGGAVGLMIAFAILQWFVAARPDMSRVESIHMDAWVAAFVLAVVLGCAFLASLVSSFSVRGGQILSSLQESSRSQSAGECRVRLRKVLLTLEVGLTTVLLIGAGLLVKSYERLRESNLGCITDNVLTMQLSLPEAVYSRDVERVNFFKGLLERVRALPGVEGAGLVRSVPGWGYPGDSGFAVAEHAPLPLGKEQYEIVEWADPKYFAAMGIPLLRGQTFDENQQLGNVQEAIISEALAKKYFPNEDPIGKHLITLGKRPFRIVGIVGDTRYSPLQPPQPIMYFPLYSVLYGGIPPFATLAVHSSRDVTALALPIQRIVQQLDPELAVSDVLTMDQVIGKMALNASFDATLMVAFGGLSLILAAVGLFGVLSYIVGERIHEIGIRMALGAQRPDVLRLIVGEGARLTVVGILIGILGAIGLTRLMSSLLFEVKPTDPATFVGVAILLAVVALLACYIPARRAMKVDPMVALRYE